eukprot:m.214608 g.214608  ORF g.214608 m.214608 type:complete len:163 (-) comp19072_c0_seq3:1906-2394(-)
MVQWFCRCSCENCDLEIMEADDESTALPKATVLKVVKEHMPAGMKMAPEAKDLIFECCNEFVQLVGSEAQAQCLEAKSSTIRPADVLKALEELEMTDFLEKCQMKADESSAARKVKRERSHSNKLESRAKKNNISMEDMKRLQQKQLEAARARMAGAGEAAS